jgi:16S rRNA (adenine(1408)-N(1))-methyltransferase
MTRPLPIPWTAGDLVVWRPREPGLLPPFFLFQRHENGRREMESIRGKQRIDIGAVDLAAIADRYQGVAIDLGTGDGRYVLHAAKRRTDWLTIGVDACRENLRRTSRIAPGNAVFLIADALSLPADLAPLATKITLNFPWGSLLQGLLSGDPALIGGLLRVGRPKAEVTVLLNGGAAVDAGWELAPATTQLRDVLAREVGGRARLHAMALAELRSVPTTWAKRLAFGRDPRAVRIGATIAAEEGRAEQSLRPPSLLHLLVFAVDKLALVARALALFPTRVFPASRAG